MSSSLLFCAVLIYQTLVSSVVCVTLCRSSVLPKPLNWDLILKLSWNQSWRIPACLSICNQSLFFFFFYHLLYALEKVLLKEKATYLWKDITIAGFHLAQKYYDFAIILNHLVQLAVAYLRWERSVKSVQSFWFAYSSVLCTSRMTVVCFTASCYICSCPNTVRIK